MVELRETIAESLDAVRVQIGAAEIALGIKDNRGLFTALDKGRSAYLTVFENAHELAALLRVSR